MREIGRILPLFLIVIFASQGLAADPPDEEEKARPGAKRTTAEAEETPAAGTAGGALDESLDAYAESERLPEMVITGTRGLHDVYDLPRRTTTVSEEDIREESPIQIVDTITRTNAGIIMDIRTGTTGDPIMRGWSGFNILTLIDGNSLSTLWGEGGFGADDMYSKIDPETIERIEILHGPYSVLWGSNALGGVINFITRSSPIDYQEEGFQGGGRVKYVYSENSGTNRTRLETYGATTNLKFLVGWSWIDAGDLEGGRGEGTLDPSSGRANNFDLRADWMVAPGQEITFQLLDINWRDTHRYYRPTQDNDSDRTGFTVSWNAEKLGDAIENFNWRIYYQHKEDTRRFYDTGREGYAKTVTYATDAQASSRVGGNNYLTYGVHAHNDEGESADDEQFTYTKPPPTQADAPDTDWTDLAAYLQDEWNATEWLDVLAAIRFDYFRFESHSTSTYRADDPFRDEDFFTDSTGALTGGLGLTFKPSDDWRILTSYSRGFRQHAPNFGFRQLGNGVLVPNDLLDPVTSDNFEIGLRTRQRWAYLELFTYYTLVHDITEVRPDTYEGKNWIDFNGNGVQDANEGVVSHQPTGGADIYGFELSGTVFPHQVVDAIAPNWSLKGGLAWNYGKTDDGEWFRHTQPLRGLLAVRWDDSDPKRQAYFELHTEMVAKYDRIPSDRVNSDLAWQRDPQNGQGAAGLLRSYGGVPGYTIFSLYGGMNVCENARVIMALENFTDKKYRRAHSRMDAPGISFTLGIEVHF